MTRLDDGRFALAEAADVVLAGQWAKRRLSSFDLEPAAVEQLVLVVHELGSNIVNHAGEGSIAVRPVEDGDRHGVEVRATDAGPGIADVERAIVDGYSTAGSLGGGLGTVHRLMDDVVVNSDGSPGSGVEVVAVRWDESSPAGRRESPYEVGAATRPKPGYERNGDAFIIEHRPGETLVGVIDGLGHGDAACEAATVAQRHVRTHSGRPIAELFDGVDRACRGTRGVVMLLARFDWDAKRATVGTVGNVNLRVCHSADPVHLVPRRGMLGGNSPAPVVRDWSVDPAAVVVVHSDGLRSRWRCDEVGLGDDRSAAELADALLRSLSTHADDATVLVVREARR